MVAVTEKLRLLPIFGYPTEIFIEFGGHLFGYCKGPKVIFTPFFSLLNYIYIYVEGMTHI